MRRIALFGAAALAIGASQEATKPQLDTTPRKLDCSRLDWLKKGRPIFVDGRDSVRYGISTNKDVVTPGEPILVDIWVDNRSDKPVWAGGRCPPYRHDGDVFDSSGRRVIGTREQAKLDAEKNGQATVEVCASAEVMVQVPAHTCMAPVDAHGDNETLDYNLTPGVYYAFPTQGTDPKSFDRGLKITVRQP